MVVKFEWMGFDFFSSSNITSVGMNKHNLFSKFPFLKVNVIKYYIQHLKDTGRALYETHVCHSGN